MRILSAGVFVIFFCAAAAAQSAKDFSPAGAYITAPVREELGQARATEFVKAASSAGFTVKETRLVAQGLREANIAIVATSGSGWRQAFKTPQGSVSVNTIEQAGLIRRAMGYLPYPTFFEKYATIRLAVTPVSPRDYKVAINGEECPITKNLTYLVAPGKANVSVIRIGNPPCAWAGTVPAAKVQTIECQL
jgi:hypothetical protein